MTRQTVAGRILPNPRGTAVDYRYIFAGAELSASDAREEETKLRANPKRLSSILILIGYYGCRKNKQSELFSLILWMINNRPGDAICYYIGHEYSTRALKWNTQRKELAAEAWHRQVRKHSKDARVLCNAASFFGHFGKRDACENYYKKAKSLNKTLALPARQLAYLYRSSSLDASKSERNILISRALAEANEAFYRRDPRGEHVYLIQQFTQTAIKYGHLQIAQKFARRLYPYVGIYGFWDQYLYIYLSWIALRTGDQEQLGRNLALLKDSFQECKSHAAGSSAAVSFLKDVVETRNADLTAQVFEIVISGAEKQKIKSELSAWLKVALAGRKPVLKELKHAFEWPF